MLSCATVNLSRWPVCSTTVRPNRFRRFRSSATSRSWAHLFKSKSFQKNETELMFIVTAQLVKPVNRDDLPQMRGVDGLKNGSPLGVEPKGEEIQGELASQSPVKTAKRSQLPRPKLGAGKSRGAGCGSEGEERERKPAAALQPLRLPTRSRVNLTLPVAQRYDYGFSTPASQTVVGVTT